ncbi:MAG: Asp-tRNA(Asn)/Glu-tRNA(Gln) amidotransferase subunit GatC [Polyangiaceae bacterium]|nr:Asp-tRNA(Asn)/Glu-tRNA(Gln) amidotransferase subunit GatC [Polyangiaceae bacterium]
MDKAQIHHVAELAELSLTEVEEQRLAVEMSAILTYVAELDALDTSDVPPTMQTIAADREPERSWRSDEVRPGLSHEDALAQAPSVEHEGFSVPSFVE